MQARFLLGPAGSGKTFRCLVEIRDALIAAPEGPPLLLIAPKQTTYQLERQLLARVSMPGYTRLHILSFDRLASFVLERLKQPEPRMINEEGRLMVLRALLARKRDSLKLFRASARLTGFAQHLSVVLRELQRQQLTPESLQKLADETHDVESLSFKLQDLATLLQDYLDWLTAHELQDADHLLTHTRNILRAPHLPLQFGEIWVDGFTDFSPQELDLLTELLPQTEQATIAFCLDRIPAEKYSWLSNGASVERAFQSCRQRVAALPQCQISTTLIPRQIEKSRFAGHPVLHHLESSWGDPKPYSPPLDILKKSLRVAACADPEAEATLAAREILRSVRRGGRYREITVLTRNLQPYHEVITNVFNRYQIPFFLDRRESVSHHPLAELTRNALRTIAYSWARDDWFAALKTGLVPAAETDIDRLENEALARGWKGSMWQQPLVIPNESDLTALLEKVRLKIVPPFNKLALRLRMAKQSNKPTGTELAEALREFWQTLNVEQTLQEWSADKADPRPIHLTVWEQMTSWLENLELSFPVEPLGLRDWLPILEAGLAGLTVGVIPPALDQVFVGAIDRSRNPDIRLALVLGMNETVFPAPPKTSVLLTDNDRLALEKQDIALVNTRQQLGQERHYGYVAFTRARERLILMFSEMDANGKPLNESPFISHLQRMFPQLEIARFPRKLNWVESEHENELVVPLLQNEMGQHDDEGRDLTLLGKLPEIAKLQKSLRHLAVAPAAEALFPALAAKLYGADLRTSVSRMEQFAACPFKFFVHSGLRAEERKLFELDHRDQGNFQHEILAFFHEQLMKEHKLWRDISPTEARERIKAIAIAHAQVFREGLLQSTEKGRFTAKVLTEALQDFVETIIGWMRRQYAFDPLKVELPFGSHDNPPWKLSLGKHQLILSGRIDRIDLCVSPNGDEAQCVVVDYKSSQKKLDPVLMEHGLQLQLPAYLNVLRHWPKPRALFGVSRLVPAGVFYVSLRGRYDHGLNRTDALENIDAARKQAYRHTGRFDLDVLRKLDQSDATRGDQFNYIIKKDGTLSGNSHEALQPPEFMALLDHVETVLQQMGRDVYAGVAKVDPYQKGNMTACEHCDYRAVCRIDPWTHPYRVLRKTVEDEA